METEIGNLLLLSVRWAHSVFHWCYHLATFIFPFTGLEDVIAHSSVQFSSVPQSCRLFETSWIAAHQASLCITNSCSLLKLMSIESVMLSNHLILCCPLLLLPSICPSIRVFSSESVLHIRWRKYWSFNFSISPSNEY